MTKKMMLNLKKHKYTLKQKQTIVQQVYDITDEDVLYEFNKLVEIGCKRHAKLSHMGNKIVNKFTAVERLNTTGKKGIGFYDVIYNKQRLKNEKYVKKILSIKTFFNVGTHVLLMFIVNHISYFPYTK